MEPETFRSLLRRVRAGDAQAAVELVRAYEPSLRRQIRIQLTDPRLRRLMDSLDVCQSVLGNFFFRVLSGEFDLESPSQLAGLLATMARNRILNHAREQYARRRDARRVLTNGEGALLKVADKSGNTCQIVADAELIARALAELTAEERQLIEERAMKQSWEDIAQHHGKSSEALRKKLDRAIERVTRMIGLKDG